MTKDEKIASLATAMTASKREDGETFNHFTDTAPEELKALYLESYEVKDIDYETFNRACDIVSEIYAERADTMEKDEQDASIDDEIQERADGSASVYTYTALQYLDNYNQAEIADTVRELGGDIATACMYWYDNQVAEAGRIINAWVNAE